MSDNRVLAVSGASGLIGSALVSSLRADGHEVRRLVRRPSAVPGDVQWDPAAGAIDRDGLAGVDGVVHLAGAGVGDRLWTRSYRQTIVESRTRGTELLARTCASLDPLPRVFVSGSAVGYYGDTGDAVADEDAPRGTGFLSDVVEAWESAAAPAQHAGIRTPFARTGVVTTIKGGALSRLLPLVRLGLGGRLGSGRQWWPLISLDDEVRALRLLLDDDRATGPYNLVSSAHQVSEVVRALGAAYSRPTVLPVPAFVLRTALGGMSSVVLSSQRIAGTRLSELGFLPRDAGLEGIIGALARERHERSDG